METIYLNVIPIQTWWLRLVGRLLLLGKAPLHSQLYWQQDGRCFMSELNEGRVAAGGVVIGKGDGYQIQITPVPKVQGVAIPCELAAAIRAMKQYASIEKGDLIATNLSKHWYAEPQGYGGPEYDTCTCNTYAKWVLSRSCKTVPPALDGAIGWDHVPMFPGPPLSLEDMQPN